MSISWEAPKTIRIGYVSNASNIWKVEWVPLTGEPVVWEQTLATTEGQEDVVLDTFDETWKLIIDPATPGVANAQYNVIGEWTNMSMNVALNRSFSYNGIETLFKFINPCYIRVEQMQDT